MQHTIFSFTMTVSFFYSKYYYILLLLLSVFSLTKFSNCLCLDDQKSLLLAFRSEFVYDPLCSAITVGWNRTNEDCCNWNGVECDVEGRVIALQLHHEVILHDINNLSALFHFMHMERLNLAHNDFRGSMIPNAIRKLTRLRHLNLSNARFSGQLPLGLSSLRRLVSLDLSTDVDVFSTFTPLRIENPNLKTILQNLTRIKELNLDGIEISGQGGEWGYVISSSLPSLQILSLRHCRLSGPPHSSLAQLSSLSVLRLDHNSLSTTVPNFFANLSSLTTFTLSYCHLKGYFPDRIFYIPSLEYLDISYNEDLVGTLPQFSPTIRTILLSHTNFSGSFRRFVSNDRMLSRIDLSMCNFSGALPLDLANLTELTHLDLSYNSFSGSIPPLLMLRKLRHINLSGNKLTGSLSFIIHESTFNLEYLNLRNNSIDGSIPRYLLGIPSLVTLVLSYNNFSGPFNEFSAPDFSSLEVLDLSGNKLEGPVPDSLFKLERLRSLSLNDNLFNGTIRLRKFQSFLKRLDLSRNNLSVDATDANSSTPAFSRLNTLRLESCNMYDFPDLRNQSYLRSLDLSHNHITGGIPTWIWEVGRGRLEELNLAFNLLVDIKKPYNISSLLDVLDLRWNQIEGHLLYIPFTVSYMDFSYNNFESFQPLLAMGNVSLDSGFLSLANNRLRGTIPTSLCDAMNLLVLDLSGNKLSGKIPPCLLKDLQHLKLLNLGKNDITGNIPDSFSRNCSLETLDLRNNNLRQKIPPSLANCKSIEVVNVGYNKIEDTFPCIMPMSLRILVLRSNKFHGELTCNKSWSNLQIIDIAQNNFTGYLYSTNFLSSRGMLKDNYELRIIPGHIDIEVWTNLYYVDTVTLTFKGRELELTKILRIFTSIDYSCNNFQGDILDIVGDFKLLYVLNLSHNGLTGTIPKSFGNLLRLESLDLSMNLLTGEIPRELAGLTFLSVLNVSHNKLVGEIPQGRQFQTFTASTFQGNAGLCGFPLDKSCDITETGKSHEIEEDVEIEWEYISAAVGFGVGFGSIIWLVFGYEGISRGFSEKADEILEGIFSNRNERKRGHKRGENRNQVRR